MASCRGCGKAIKWIKTVDGRNMPCDPGKKIFRPNNGRGFPETFVLEDGRTMYGRLVDTPEEGDVIGYISHWATCTEAGQFKRGKARRRYA